MTTYTPKTFTIPTLKGISAKNIEEHLKLYQGYVKNANLINEKLATYRTDLDVNAYILGELNRRFSFEYNGIRNHEAYFSAFEGGPKALDSGGKLKKAIESEWGSFENWLAIFKNIAATTRGIGWAMLLRDPRDGRLLMAWVDEQHIGQLNQCFIILALDMWEHSYVSDYQPSGKKAYIEDFFSNLNWSVIEDNFSKSNS